MEFVFGTASEAEAFCRRMRWKPFGRAAWRKPDGTVVYFICLVEQLAAVKPGTTVYVLGRLPSEASRKLKKIGAVVVHVE
jgi:hypothetical protein